MVKKCKKGSRRVGGLCIWNKTYKKFKGMSDEYKVLKLALIGALTSVGGWAIFLGIVEVAKLRTLPWWAMILLGMGVILLTYKFGFDKIK